MSKLKTETLLRFSKELSDIIKEAYEVEPDKGIRWLRWCKQAKANIDEEIRSRDPSSLDKIAALDLREFLGCCPECKAIGDPEDNRHKPWCSALEE